MKKYLFVIAAGSFFVLAGQTGLAGGKNAEPPAPAASLALINEFDGAVQYRAAGSDEAVSPEIDQPLAEGDEITTGADGSAEILLADRSVVKVENNSRLVIGRLAEKNSSVKLLVGHCIAVIERLINQPVNFSVETGKAIAAVKGTEFVVATAAEGDRIAVIDGAVGVTGPDGKGEGVLVRPEQETLVAPGKKPVKPGKAGAWMKWYRPRLEKLRARAVEVRKLQATGELAKLRVIRRALIRNEVLKWFKNHPGAFREMTPRQKVQFLKHLRQAELTPEERAAIKDAAKNHREMMEKVIRKQQSILEGLREKKESSRARGRRAGE